MLTLFGCHSSASLLSHENADPDVQGDLNHFFARLVPDGDPLFRHRDAAHGGEPFEGEAEKCALMTRCHAAQGERHSTDNVDMRARPHGKGGSAAETVLCCWVSNDGSTAVHCH